MMLRVLILGLVLISMSSVASAVALTDLESPTWEMLQNAWTPHTPADSTDKLVKSVFDGTNPLTRNALTREIVHLLMSDSDTTRAFILLHIIEKRGGRNPDAQHILSNILSSGTYHYNKQALIDGILTSSTDGLFLALALDEPDQLFTNVQHRHEIMDNQDKWRDVPGYLNRCVVENLSFNPEQIAFDDLERRMRCMYGLTHFLTLESLGYLEHIAFGYPLVFGTDASRVMRSIIEQALSRNMVTVRDQANEILLQMLRDPGFRREPKYSTFRLNAAVGLSVRGNLTVDGPVRQLLAVEQDPYVARLLRTALEAIHMRP